MIVGALTAPAGADAQRRADLDRLRFGVYEACDISTHGVVKQSGVPWERAKAALAQLLADGEVTNYSGHHHDMDGDLCSCLAGEAAGLPALTHWYSSY